MQPTKEREQTLVATSFIVRHGAMRFLGTFEADDGTGYRRGDHVVARTDRGLEAGDVLCEAEPRTVALLTDPTRGRIVRRLTDEDRAVCQRLKDGQRQELETCGKLV